MATICVLECLTSRVIGLTRHIRQLYDAATIALFAHMDNVVHDANYVFDETSPKPLVELKAESTAEQRLGSVRQAKEKPAMPSRRRPRVFGREMVFSQVAAIGDKAIAPDPANNLLAPLPAEIFAVHSRCWTSVGRQWITVPSHHLTISRLAPRQA